MSEENTANNTAPEEVAEEELHMPEEEIAQFGVQEDKTAHLGAILGILIVALVLILGGLYIWGTMMSSNSYDVPTPNYERPTAEENNEPESTQAEAEIETMQAVSTSNEIEAIEADLDATDLDALDAELQAIEAELDSALGGS